MLQYECDENEVAAQRFSPCQSDFGEIAGLVDISMEVRECRKESVLKEFTQFHNIKCCIYYGLFLLTSNGEDEEKNQKIFCCSVI